MNEEIKIGLGIAAALVILWALTQNFGAPKANPVKAPCRKRWNRQKAGGDVWAKPVISANLADDGDAYPPAYVL
jgi:hypothetical protein